VQLVRLRRPKTTCSPSYEDYRPTTNVAILWNMGHTYRRPCTGRLGQSKETKNSNVIDMLNRNEYRNLKLAGATMGGGIGECEEDW
jgi:hypothetical protein